MLKCPLISAPFMSPTGQISFAVSGCIGADCVKWNGLRNECRDITLDRQLQRLCELLDKKEVKTNG
jgi:hypothetical protein